MDCPIRFFVSIKAISTIEMYSNVFAAYRGVFNYNVPTEAPSPEEPVKPNVEQSNENEEESTDDENETGETEESQNQAEKPVNEGENTEDLPSTEVE